MEEIFNLDMTVYTIFINIIWMICAIYVFVNYRKMKGCQQFIKIIQNQTDIFTEEKQIDDVDFFLRILSKIHIFCTLIIFAGFTIQVIGLNINEYFFDFPFRYYIISSLFKFIYLLLYIKVNIMFYKYYNDIRNNLNLNN